MAFLSSAFQRNRQFLLGEEEERPPTGGLDPLEPEFDLSGDTRTPEYDLSGDIRTPGGTPQTQRRAPTGAPSIQAFGSRRRQTIAPSTPTTPPSPSTTTPPATAPSTGPAELKAAPTLPSFQRTGSLSERLFSPLTEGAAGGQESLSSAASLFKQEAGPSRTYESTGAQETLSDAYKTGSQPSMESARDYLAARYEGPQGLDQNTVAGLQKLTDDLQTRQRALSTGGGLQTLIGQSVAGLTPGEAAFEAKRRLPESRVTARDMGFQQVSPLVGRLLQERQAAQDFADQRTAEEAGIADRSRGFLESERGGISGAIQALMDERAAQQAAAEQAYADILAATSEGRLDAIRGASQYLTQPGVPEGEFDVSNDIRLPPGTFDVSDDVRLPPGTTSGSALAESFFTPAMQDKADADALFQKIMNDPRFASISEYDPLELGVTNRAKQFYDIEDEEGNIQDIRSVVEDKAVRQLLYDRQAELEAAFDPHRGARRPFSRTPAEAEGTEDYSTIRPLYFGDEEGFQPLDPVEYLGFDPGLKPSRENTSSEVQRTQFNRINDLLDELDRIAEGGEVFRAAKIWADANRYVEDESAALEGRKEELTDSAKEWAGQVKKLRRKLRKAKRKKNYGQIGSVIGTIVGTYTPLSAVGGSYWGGIAGKEIGESLA